jgi:hypothetical protein
MQHNLTCEPCPGNRIAVFVLLPFLLLLESCLAPRALKTLRISERVIILSFGAWLFR